VQKLVNGFGEVVEGRAIEPGGFLLALAAGLVLPSTRTGDGEAADRKEATTWLTCTAFDRLAETIGEHLHKGSKVYREGRPSARAWTGKQGDAQASLDVIVSTLEMLDPKASANLAAAQAPEVGHPEHAAVPF
jgi:single-strand DNA-binding protein